VISSFYYLLGEFKMLVKDRMTRNPVTAQPETTHKQAAELMRDQNVHHLPIVNKQGELVGIVVHEDLLSAQPSPATTLSIYEIHSLLSKLQLKQIMRHPVITVGPDCPLEEAASLMLHEDIGCLPVMENDQLVGIITDTDVFETLVDLLGGGHEGARFTLRLPDKPGYLAKVAQAVADAGGNIISATAWRTTDAGYSYITIKESGAAFSQLQEKLKFIEAELVDVRENPACQHKLYE
jgi:acetoin utilization protein AcuB